MVVLGIIWFVRPRGFAAAGVTGKPTKFAGAYAMQSLLRFVPGEPLMKVTLAFVEALRGTDVPERSGGKRDCAPAGQAALAEARADRPEQAVSAN